MRSTLRSFGSFFLAERLQVDWRQYFSREDAKILLSERLFECLKEKNYGRVADSSFKSSKKEYEWLSMIKERESFFNFISPLVAENKNDVIEKQVKLKRIHYWNNLQSKLGSKMLQDIFPEIQSYTVSRYFEITEPSIGAVELKLLRRGAPISSAELEHIFSLYCRYHDIEGYARALDFDMLIQGSSDLEEFVIPKPVIPDSLYGKQMISKEILTERRCCELLRLMIFRRDKKRVDALINFLVKKNQLRLNSYARIIDSYAVFSSPSDALEGALNVLLTVSCVKGLSLMHRITGYDGSESISDAVKLLSTEGDFEKNVEGALVNTELTNLCFAHSHKRSELLSSLLHLLSTSNYHNVLVITAACFMRVIGRSYQASEGPDEEMKKADESNDGLQFILWDWANLLLSLNMHMTDFTLLRNVFGFFELKDSTADNDTFGIPAGFISIRALLQTLIRKQLILPDAAMRIRKLTSTVGKDITKAVAMFEEEMEKKLLDIPTVLDNVFDHETNKYIEKAQKNIEVKDMTLLNWMYFADSLIQRCILKTGLGKLKILEIPFQQAKEAVNFTFDARYLGKKSETFKQYDGPKYYEWMSDLQDIFSRDNTADSSTLFYRRNWNNGVQIPFPTSDTMDRYQLLPYYMEAIVSVFVVLSATEGFYSYGEHYTTFILKKKKSAGNQKYDIPSFSFSALMKNKIYMGFINRKALSVDKMSEHILESAPLYSQTDLLNKTCYSDKRMQHRPISVGPLCENPSELYHFYFLLMTSQKRNSQGLKNFKLLKQAHKNWSKWGIDKNLTLDYIVDGNVASLLFKYNKSYDSKSWDLFCMGNLKLLDQLETFQGLNNVDKKAKLTFNDLRENIIFFPPTVSVEFIHEVAMVIAEERVPERLQFNDAFTYLSEQVLMQGDVYFLYQKRLNEKSIDNKSLESFDHGIFERNFAVDARPLLPYERIFLEGYSILFASGSEEMQYAWKRIEELFCQTEDIYANQRIAASGLKSDKADYEQSKDNAERINAIRLRSRIAGRYLVPSRVAKKFVKLYAQVCSEHPPRNCKFTPETLSERVRWANYLQAREMALALCGSGKEARDLMKYLYYNYNLLPRIRNDSRIQNDAQNLLLVLSPLIKSGVSYHANLNASREEAAADMKMIVGTKMFLTKNEDSSEDNMLVDLHRQETIECQKKEKNNNGEKIKCKNNSILNQNTEEMSCSEDYGVILRQFRNRKESDTLRYARSSLNCIDFNEFKQRKETLLAEKGYFPLKFGIFAVEPAWTHGITSAKPFPSLKRDFDFYNKKSMSSETKDIEGNVLGVARCSENVVWNSFLTAEYLVPAHIFDPLVFNPFPYCTGCFSSSTFIRDRVSEFAYTDCVPVIRSEQLKLFPHNLSFSKNSKCAIFENKKYKYVTDDRNLLKFQPNSKKLQIEIKHSLESYTTIEIDSVYDWNASNTDVFMSKPSFFDSSVPFRKKSLFPPRTSYYYASDSFIQDPFHALWTYVNDAYASIKPGSFTPWFFHDDEMFLLLLKSLLYRLDWENAAKVTLLFAQGVANRYSAGWGEDGKGAWPAKVKYAITSYNRDYFRLHTGNDFNSPDTLQNSTKASTHGFVAKNTNSPEWNFLIDHSVGRMFAEIGDAAGYLPFKVATKRFDGRITSKINRMGRINAMI